MKKLIAIILAAILVLSLFACASGSTDSTDGTDGAKEAAAFQAGFGKADISPRDDGVPMNGFSLSTERLSTGLQSYLFSLAVAVRDGEGNTAVMVSLDHTSLSVLMADEVRDWAEQELGIPRENIILSAIHQHSCPDPSGSSTQVHSDWPGIMRDIVTEELGAHCVYFSGAGGNLNSTSRIEEENISVDYKDHGKRAAQYVVGAEDSYTKVNTGKVVSKEITVAYEADRSMDHLYEQAKVVADARKRSTDEATMSNASMGYIPSQLDYTNGGYSTDITKFAPGTGEQVVGDMLQILNEIHP